MYVSIRTFDLKEDKYFEGIQWAQGMTELFNDEFGVQAKILTAVSGPTQRIQVVSEYDSLADFEDLMSKMLAHPKIQEFGKQRAELTVEGTSTHNIYRSV
tara:strand:- start:540 stop:839 length:300 start_codon:yes stop_codon:yes gene_type:complete